MCSYQKIHRRSLSIICELNDEEFFCPDNVQPDTTAKIRCQTGYESPQGSVRSKLTCLKTGNWSHLAHQCFPVCGKVTVHSTPYQIGG